MDEIKLRIRPAAVLTAAAKDVDALLDAGDGDAALLYLHILRNGGVLDAARAARELHRSDRDIDTAAGRLREMGLLAPGAARREKPLPERELPEYSAEDVVSRSQEDPQFKGLVDEVQMALGRTLSSADLKKLFGIYDRMGMPPEVILLLIQFCKETLTAQFGPEKTVGFAYIEKAAFRWLDEEILSYEQAEQWLREQAQRKTAMERLRRGMGIYERRVSATERKYMDSWLAMGFPEETILLAYDRTVVKTGGLKWSYMNAILQSWASKGLHTPEEIEKGDRRPDRPGKNAPVPRDETKTMEQVRRLREKIKKN